LRFGSRRRPPSPFLGAIFICNHLLHGSTPSAGPRSRSALACRQFMGPFACSRRPACVLSETRRGAFRKEIPLKSTPDLISHFSACSAFPRDDGLAPQALVPDPAFAASGWH
jgi:hypothetical protein